MSLIPWFALCCFIASGALLAADAPELAYLVAMVGGVPLLVGWLWLELSD